MDPTGSTTVLGRPGSTRPPQMSIEEIRNNIWCFICAGKTFVSQKMLEKHLRQVHLMWFPYECQYCGQTKVSTDDELKEHLADKHPNKPTVLTYEADDTMQAKLDDLVAKSAMITNATRSRLEDAFRMNSSAVNGIQPPMTTSQPSAGQTPVVNADVVSSQQRPVSRQRAPSRTDLAAAAAALQDSTVSSQSSCGEEQPPSFKRPLEPRASTRTSQRPPSTFPGDSDAAPPSDTDENNTSFATSDSDASAIGRSPIRKSKLESDADCCHLCLAKARGVRQQREAIIRTGKYTHVVLHMKNANIDVLQYGSRGLSDRPEYGAMYDQCFPLLKKRLDQPEQTAAPATEDEAHETSAQARIAEIINSVANEQQRPNVRSDTDAQLSESEADHGDQDSSDDERSASASESPPSRTRPVVSRRKTRQSTLNSSRNISRQMPVTPIPATPPGKHQRTTPRTATTPGTQMAKSTDKRLPRELLGVDPNLICSTSRREKTPAASSADRSKDGSQFVVSLERSFATTERISMQRARKTVAAVRSPSPSCSEDEEEGRPLSTSPSPPPTPVQRTARRGRMTSLRGRRSLPAETTRTRMLTRRSTCSRGRGGGRMMSRPRTPDVSPIGSPVPPVTTEESSVATTEDESDGDENLNSIDSCQRTQPVQLKRQYVAPPPRQSVCSQPPTMAEKEPKLKPTETPPTPKQQRPNAATAVAPARVESDSDDDDIIFEQTVTRSVNCSFSVQPKRSVAKLPPRAMSAAGQTRDTDVQLMPPEHVISDDDDDTDIPPRSLPGCARSRAHGVEAAREKRRMMAKRNRPTNGQRVAANATSKARILLPKKQQPPIVNSPPRQTVVKPPPTAAAADNSVRSNRSSLELKNAPPQVAQKDTMVPGKRRGRPPTRQSPVQAPPAAQKQTVVQQPPATQPPIKKQLRALLPKAMLSAPTPPSPKAQLAIGVASASESDTSMSASDTSYCSSSDMVDCTLCRSKVRPIFALAHVYKKHIAEKLLKCNHCDFRLCYSTAKMRKHIRSCHRNAPVEFTDTRDQFHGLAMNYQKHCFPDMDASALTKPTQQTETAAKTVLLPPQHQQRTSVLPQELNTRPPSPPRHHQQLARDEVAARLAAMRYVAQTQQTPPASAPHQRSQAAAQTNSHHVQQPQQPRSLNLGINQPLPARQSSIACQASTPPAAARYPQHLQQQSHQQQQTPNTHTNSLATNRNAYTVRTVVHKVSTGTQTPSTAAAGRDTSFTSVRHQPPPAPERSISLRNTYGLQSRSCQSDSGTQTSVGVGPGSQMTSVGVGQSHMSDRRQVALPPHHRQQQMQQQYRQDLPNGHAQPQRATAVGNGASPDIICDATVFKAPIGTPPANRRNSLTPQHSSRYRMTQQQQPLSATPPIVRMVQVSNQQQTPPSADARGRGVSPLATQQTASRTDQQMFHRSQSQPPSHCTNTSIDRTPPNTIGYQQQQQQMPGYQMRQQQQQRTQAQPPHQLTPRPRENSFVNNRPQQQLRPQQPPMQGGRSCRSTAHQQQHRQQQQQIGGPQNRPTLSNATTGGCGNKAGSPDLNSSVNIDPTQQQRNGVSSATRKCALCNAMVSVTTLTQHATEQHMKNKRPFECTVCKCNCNATFQEPQEGRAKPWGFDGLRLHFKEEHPTIQTALVEKFIAVPQKELQAAMKLCYPSVVTAVKSEPTEPRAKPPTPDIMVVNEQQRPPAADAPTKRRCQVCREIVLDARTKEHVSARHRPLYQCPFCDYQDRNFETVRKHVKQGHPDKPTPVEDGVITLEKVHQICFPSFIPPIREDDVSKTRRDSLEKELIIPPQGSCRICDVKVHRERMDAHTWTHMQKDRAMAFRCPHCPFGDRSLRKSVVQHLGVAHPKEPVMVIDNRPIQKDYHLEMKYKCFGKKRPAPPKPNGAKPATTEEGTAAADKSKTPAASDTIDLVDEEGGKTAAANTSANSSTTTSSEQSATTSTTDQSTAKPTDSSAETTTTTEADKETPSLATTDESTTDKTTPAAADSETTPVTPTTTSVSAESTAATSAAGGDGPKSDDPNSTASVSKEKAATAEGNSNETNLQSEAEAVAEKKDSVESTPTTEPGLASDKYVNCRRCRGTVEINDVHVHLVYHIGTKPVSCGHCNYQGYTAKELKAHCAQKHPEEAPLMSHGGQAYNDKLDSMMRSCFAVVDLQKIAGCAKKGSSLEERRVKKEQQQIGQAAANLAEQTKAAMAAAAANPQPPPSAPSRKKKVDLNKSIASSEPSKERRGRKRKQKEPTDLNDTSLSNPSGEKRKSKKSRKEEEEVTADLNESIASTVSECGSGQWRSKTADDKSSNLSDSFESLASFRSTMLTSDANDSFSSDRSLLKTPIPAPPLSRGASSQKTPTAKSAKKAERPKSVRKSHKRGTGIIVEPNKDAVQLMQWLVDTVSDIDAAEMKLKRRQEKEIARRQIEEADRFLETWFIKKEEPSTASPVTKKRHNEPAPTPSPVPTKRRRKDTESAPKRTPKKEKKCKQEVSVTSVPFPSTPSHKKKPAKQQPAKTPQKVKEEPAPKNERSATATPRKGRKKAVKKEAPLLLMQDPSTISLSSSPVPSKTPTATPLTTISSEPPATPKQPSKSTSKAALSAANGGTWRQLPPMSNSVAQSIRQLPPIPRLPKQQPASTPKQEPPSASKGKQRKPTAMTKAEPASAVKSRIDTPPPRTPSLKQKKAKLEMKEEPVSAVKPRSAKPDPQQAQSAPREKPKKQALVQPLQRQPPKAQPTTAPSQPTVITSLEDLKDAQREIRQGPQTQSATGLKLVKCKVCLADIFSKSAQFHVWKHHLTKSVRPFLCAHCGEGFTVDHNERAVKTHFETHHPRARIRLTDARVGKLQQDVETTFRLCFPEIPPPPKRTVTKVMEVL